MKLLTDEEHKTYVHICGKTLTEVEKMESYGFFPCNICGVKSKCMSDHALIGVDDNIVKDRKKQLEKFHGGK